MPREGVKQMIAWKTLPLLENLERIERRLDEMEPFIAEALGEVRLAKGRPNLPDYLTQKLKGLEEELAGTLPRLRNRVKSVRNAIPENAIARERKQSPLKF